MNYILYPHSGSGNHGCEAIVRTTTSMLAEQNVTLFSDHPEEDRRYIENADFSMISPRREMNRFSFPYFSAFCKRHILHDDHAYDLAVFSPVTSMLTKDTTLVSIGGDNYCYGDNEYIYMINRAARKKKAKTVLWGCSVEASGISEAMKDDLEGYDLIVARESVSYRTLKNFNKNVVLYPDPAFTLKKGKGILPEIPNDKPWIGVNVSPLIRDREPIPGITMENYSYLIRNILDTTEYNVLLIPHVIWEISDDRKPLGELYESFLDTNRVFLVEDQNCMDLKNIISRCVFFVGARTHATIAAYSSCVPTLTIGYSVKAKGIAADLFGTDKDYVLPVQNVRKEEDIWKTFSRLYEKRDRIKGHLQQIMPAYIEKARSAKNTLLGL